MAGKTVWVSGASSGLGMATAKALVQAGWQVISGARSFLGDEAAGELGMTLPLDVRSQQSVDAFVQRAMASHGAPDALVNAAGILVFGPGEETSLTEYEAVMDTIFFGAVRLTQAVLPLMRQKGGGKIVMLSSVNGLMPTPFQSAYVAAKHALEGFSECLLLETRPLGIQVMLVEPGDHQGGQGKYRGSALALSSVYADSFNRVVATIKKDEATGSDPLAFGEKLARVLQKKKLPTRLFAGALKEKAAIILHDILPGRLFARFLADYYKV